MKNKLLKANIKELDVQIAVLMEKIKECNDANKRKVLLDEVDALTELRIKLGDSLEASSHVKEILTGAFGIASMGLVLHFEKANVVTSKAFSMVGKVFRG